MFSYVNSVMVPWCQRPLSTLWWHRIHRNNYHSVINDNCKIALEIFLWRPKRRCESLTVTRWKWRYCSEHCSYINKFQLLTNITGVGDRWGKGAIAPWFSVRGKTVIHVVCAVNFIIVILNIVWLRVAPSKNQPRVVTWKNLWCSQ